MNKTSAFRLWCQEKWFEHCDEIESWTGNRVQYLSAEYFSKYKYWLKREFKLQQRNNNA